ncbi:ATP-grasp domain-containing protein [Clostridium autoethanogenum]|uniref:ATP-grasp domain-containing protein n=1 Tax=Clostridium autoethanogenum TaxID=84023 RepID=A0A3M0T253_9CLOT|nr:ATP-grasp domain-containing protein [Clostridium autoethanogenum]RMD04325.1 ATP-grasp domain-containing protein [Clostridium autoethanogenum]
MKILLTDIGDRVQLINCLKNSCTVIGADYMGRISPAAAFVDQFYSIPKFDDSNYINLLLDICKSENIDFLIPLHEGKFYTLCENRQKFTSIGTTLLLSSEKIIDICQNKLKTYKFLGKNKISSPKSYSKIEMLKLIENNHVDFPLIVKPINGTGSVGVFKVYDINELNFFIKYIKEPIVQEYVDGTEYTVDVLCDLHGFPISIVPRERIEVKAGEVLKSRTVMHRQIIKETYKLIKDLVEEVDSADNIRAVGPFTIQCKVTKDDEIKFIEINPRFGGGVPLTFKAGVDYGKYFNMMVRGQEIEPVIGKFEEVTMLRYNEAIFIK